MKLPIGFRAGATRANIKPSGKPDLALLVSGTPCAWAYVGTQNMAAAPSVGRGRRLYASGEALSAVIVNAGNANCATGQEGVVADVRMAEIAASRLAFPASQVLTASTGVIGVPLPLDKIESSIGTIQLAPSLDPFAEAIMTTDLVMKVAEAGLSSGARVVGVCKGSGMIQPNMATLLAFVTTDAEVWPEVLQAALTSAVERTFNCVTVDGDTSTNDTLVILANGASGVRITPESPAHRAFCDGLVYVFTTGTPLDARCAPQVCRSQWTVARRKALASWSLPSAARLSAA